jgi:hypothetical protein
MASTTQDGDLLEARREEIRRHSMRRAIRPLAAQGRSLDAGNLRQELPHRPAMRLIEYHLSILRQLDLLSL